MKKLFGVFLAAALIFSCVCGTALAARGCEHNWVQGSGPADRAATCSDGGVITMVCTICGATTPQSIGPLDHYWSAWETVETASGPMEQRLCLRCGAPNLRPLQEAEPSAEPDAEPVDEQPAVLPVFAPAWGGISPNLVLTVTQSVPAAVCHAGDNVVFSWSVTNTGNEACSLNSLEGVFAHNTGSYTRICEVVLEPGQMVSGTGSFELPVNAAADAYSDYITFRAYGLGCDDGLGCVSNEQVLAFNIQIADLDEWTPDGLPVVLPDEYSPLVPVEADLPYGGIGGGDPSAMAKLAAYMVVPDERVYYAGEQIDYYITIANCCDENLTYVNGYVYPDGVLLICNADLMPGQFAQQTSSHTVTAYDVAMGYVDLWADAVGLDEAGDFYGATSNIVTLYTAAPADGVEIHKAVISTPMVGGYYTDGENIIYEFELTNYTGGTVTDVEVIDPMLGTMYVGTMAPGETRYVSSSYCVTGYDASVGLVTNAAICQYWREDGVMSTKLSNTVNVSVCATIQNIEINLYEASTPANGSFYVPGEIVDYNLVIFNGSSYDPAFMKARYSLNGEPAVLLAELDLGSGWFVPLAFSHTVTDTDVARGNVEAVGFASFSFGAKMSNVVTVPVGTGGGTVVSGSGIGPNAAGTPPCTLTLTGLGDQTMEYDMHFCQTHQACSLDAAQLNDPQLVAEVWKEAIEELFTVCEEESSGTAAAVVSMERDLFWNMIDARIAMLRSMGMEEAQIARRIDQVLTMYCAELCCAVNTAPAARADSYASSHASLPAQTAEICSDTVAASGDDGFHLTRQICEDHALTETAVRPLLESGSMTDAVSAMRIRQVDLDQLTRTIYAGAEESVQAQIAADRLAFGGWLKNHIELMKLIYGEDAAQPYELAAQTILARIADLENVN